MSTAHAETADAAQASPKKAGGKKKLIIIVAVALLVVLIGGGAAVFMMKKKAAAAAAAAEAEDDEEVAEVVHDEKKKHDKSKKPTFVPLEPFVVNLADKESERYAQIGVTLEVEDPKVAEDIKVYMPAIRNGILMTLSHKTSSDLLSREGKLALADEIMEAATEPLGFEAPSSGGKKKKKKGGDEHGPPITRVHFSNFIVQ